MKDYIIDFDLYSAHEIIRIVSFFRMVEEANKHTTEALKQAYKEYKKIVANISLEKKYDAMLYQKSKVSIYQTMRKLR